MKLSLCSAALIFASVIAMAQDRRAVAPPSPAVPFDIERAFRPLPLACGEAPVLACGVSRTATTSCLSSNYYVDIFTINAIAGQDLAFQVTTSYAGATMSVALLDADANVLTSNQAYSSVPLNYEVVTSATLYLGLGIDKTFTSATYTVNMVCSSTTPPPPPPATSCHSNGTLKVNGSINDQLSSADDSGCFDAKYSKVYRLDVAQNDPVVITYSASYPPQMEAEPDVDGGAGVFNLLQQSGTIVVTYLPDRQGPHYVYLTSHGTGRQTGSFTVTVTAAAIDPCRRRSVSH